ncbi:hypothetical protein JW823_06145 [bacterium]|nr:hypothetical protein [candidate division CSSED10-310 bacterium]
MNEMLGLLPAFVTGALLGAVFFGGLWWTIRKRISSKWCAVWFFGSLLARTSIVLAGFYFVSGSSWKRLLTCLAGFIIARMIVMRFTRPVGNLLELAREADHAPQS